MKSERRRVLLVEDDPGIREGLQDFLEEEGYQVQVAENGQHALTVLKDAKPSIILLDLMMPVMDGYTLLEFLQTAEGGRHRGIPVVVITAAGYGAQSLASKQVAEVISKPLDLDVLLKALQRHSDISG